MAHVRNLVFGGGGPSGIAYAGALAELEKQSDFSLDNIEGVAGTSIGALFAMLVSVGFTPQEILDRLVQTNFASFKDADLGSPKRLSDHYGWYKGEVLANFIKTLLKEKTGDENITFAELKARGFKDLRVTATRMYKRDGWSTGEHVTFSAEKTPDESVADAILASTAVPGLFPAVKLKDGFLYCDGGMQNNYNIGEFDTHAEDGKTYNKATLGFYLTEPQQISDARDGRPTVQPIDFSHLGEYTAAMTYGGVFGKQDMKVRKKHVSERTVFINRVIPLWHFDVNPDVRQQLLDEGSMAVNGYFSKRLDAEYVILDSAVVPPVVTLPAPLVTSTNQSNTSSSAYLLNTLFKTFCFSDDTRADINQGQPKTTNDVACSTQDDVRALLTGAPRAVTMVRQSPSLMDVLDASRDKVEGVHVRRRTR